MSRPLTAVVLAAATTVPLAALTAGAATTQEENVVVLVNQNSLDSVAIGTAYQTIHPNVTLLNLDVPNQETIDIATYQSSILPQVQAYLGTGNNLAQTQYLVTTKGVPYRITGVNEFDSTPGDGEPDGIVTSTYSSVESELSLAGIDLFRQGTPNPQLSNSPGALINPYAKTATVDLDDDPDDFDRGSTYQPFQTFADFRTANSGNELSAYLLTSRLDGFTVGDVVGSLDRAQTAASPFGNTTIVLDRDPNIDPPIDNVTQKLDGATVVIRGAREELLSRGVDVTFDDTAANITNANDPVLAYVSLGTNGSFPDAPSDGFSFATDDLQFTLADGSVFSTYESFNGTSFLLQTDGSPANRSGQAQVAEWIAKGGTAAIGNAFEPFDLGIANEEIFLAALADGYTFADAVWMSLETTSWQNVPVGDPLFTWSVPEPTSLGFFAIGGLLLRRRKV